MAIKFRAIHTTRPWRKAQHSSIQKATDGLDGAKNLLRQIGRVGKKWQEYGPVSCIFVWDEETEPGYAFRLKPGSSYDVEMAVVPLYLLEHHDEENGCSPSVIEAYFSPNTRSHSVAAQEAPPDLTEICDAAVAAHQSPSLPILPDELPGDARYTEGLAREILVNAYERSESARSACINHHGPICQVCHLNFEERYGEIGRGYIHIHHKVPLALVGGQYQVDPINDLVPVCPNCHAMLHRQNPPLAVEDLRAKLNDGEELVCQPN